MLGLLLPIALAVLLALALGGSFAGWARQHVAFWPVLLGALVAQVVLFSPPVDAQPWAIAWGAWLWVASMLIVALVLLRNGMAHRVARGAWLVASLGVGLNMLVVVANGGYMPRSDEASAAVGRPVEEATDHRLVNTIPLTADSRLVWLGDVIPQPEWLPVANVVSVGDLLLSGGIAWWAFQVTMTVRRRAATADAVGTPVDRFTA